MMRTKGIRSIQGLAKAAPMIDIVMGTAYAFSHLGNPPANKMQARNEELARLHEFLSSPRARRGGENIMNRCLIDPSNGSSDTKLHELLTEKIWRIPDSTFERDKTELFIRVGATECVITAMKGPANATDRSPKFSVQFMFGEVTDYRDMIHWLHDECVRRVGGHEPVQLLRPSLIRDHEGERYAQVSTWQNAVPFEWAALICRYECLRAPQFVTLPGADTRTFREVWEGVHGPSPLIAGLQF